jgi:hypothetical protein
MINAEEVQCPICLENLSLMITPRITKCGHIYCWPCLLQYLAYDKEERNWKRCPLCYDPVYKHDLRNINITKGKYYREGELIKLNLQIRNKSNIILKDKSIMGEEKQNLPTQKLPYHN